MSRRARSLERLSSLNLDVPDLDTFPEADFTKFQLRPVDAIIERSISLFAVATYADILLQQKCPRDEALAFTNKFINRYGATPFFSPRETAFLAAPEPSADEVGFFCWSWECLHFLLWSLGFIESLGLPATPCSLPNCGKVFARNRFLPDVKAKAQPRPNDEIFDGIDVVHCCCRAKNQSCFESGVLNGWKRAAQWIANDGSPTEWDECK
jgi:hypothetical protein